MAASRMSSSSWRIFRRYKFFFYMCFLVLGIQLFIGYNFYTANQEELSKIRIWKQNIDEKLIGLTFTPTVPLKKGLAEGNIKPGYKPQVEPAKVESVRNYLRKGPKTDQPVDAACPVIESREALSAITRANTKECKAQLTAVECKNQKGILYPKSLPNLCYLKGEHEMGKYLGCYRDKQQERDLNSVNTEFPKDNTPQKCIDFCVTGGYLYAGLQYQKECWCGRGFGAFGSLPESSCNAACPGNKSVSCGGYNAQRVFSTGLAEKKKNSAELADLDSVRKLVPVRIVFVLTVHGRAVRQVMRLLNAIYSPTHYYYIHVDSRSAYMYRELLKLEDLLPNVRLARDRFATIWGGASLLQAHLAFMRSLLAMTDWKWDYYLNLSESDYPVSPIDKLTGYLTKHKGNNFLKSNGRETHTFIKKQGLSYTFYECENHLWRLGRRMLPTGIRVDGGSDWIVLYRDFCEYTIEATDPLVTGLKQVFQYALLPVESFFHTVLHNSQYCERWVDNNLHLTNWKRKLGCKCQHKNQVDWCGCSPNNFKPIDLDRLMKARTKAVFFARKFEAIVSQDILNSLDTELGKDLTDLPNVNYYWQNDYHYLDPWSSRTDTMLSHASSLIRRTQKIFTSEGPDCSFSDLTVIETNLLYIADSFHRYMVLYNVSVVGMPRPITLESQFSKIHHYRILDPRGPIGRLQDLEVGTDFDPKELIFRNYAGFLGPLSDVGIRHVWGQGQQITVTSAWIDPAGEIAAYQDMDIQPDSHIGHHRPKLKTPLRPGVWTVKILSRLNISAELKFTVLPFSTHKQSKLSEEDAVQLHSGPVGLYSQQDYSDLSWKLGVQNSQELSSVSVINSKKTGAELEEWIDDLSEKVWSMQDTCSTIDLGSQCPPLDLCSNTRWSSLTPDPKSEISRAKTKV